MDPRALRRIVRAGLLTGLAAFLSPAVAQNVIQARAELQPLSYIDEQGYKGCGIRAIVLEEPFSPEMHGVDLSLNVWTRPTLVGMVKASSVTAKVGPPPSLDRKPPAKITLALESSGRPLAVLKPARSDDGLYIYGSSDPLQTADLMTRLFAGERLIVSVLNAESEPYFAFAFAGTFSPKDAESFESCLRAILRE